jgi:pilus assembly protein CpaF
MTSTTTIDELCRRVADQRGDVRALIGDEIRRLAPLLDTSAKQRLADAAFARLGGLGDLDELVGDPSIDEVLVNAGREIWIDRAGELTKVGELAGRSLELIIERILAPIGRRVDRTSPIVDARLANGSRVCAVVPPVGVDGASLSIRRFAREVRSVSDFTNATGAELVAEIIDGRCNVVVTGATSSGKTSLLAAVIASLPSNERVVVLEDTAELPINAHHLVRLEARPASPDGPPAVGLTELVRTALRLRPDRLVVGEIRGDEVLGLVQAMNTGHDGSFSTCHANGPLDAMLRLESLTLQAAPTWPLAAIRQQLARSIDVVIHVSRSRNDGKRQIESISEILAPTPNRDTTPTLQVLAEIGPDGHFKQVAALSRTR